MSQNYLGGYGSSGSQNSTTVTNNQSFPHAAGAYYSYHSYPGYGQNTAYNYNSSQANQGSYGYPYNTGSNSGYFTPHASNTKSHVTTYGGTASTTTITSSKTPLNQQPVKASPANPIESYVGYDSAVYAAATNYLTSKSVGNSVAPFGGSARGLPPALTNTSSTRGFARTNYPTKRVPQYSYNQRPSPIAHYCEICKISCASSQTYREHVEGQKHKRKEMTEKSGGQPLSKSKPTYRCEVCAISCSGQDAYANHIKGAKHQRTVKLHENMGKNVSSQPTIILPGDLKKSKTAENFQDDPSFRNCLGDGTAVDTIANGINEVHLLPVGEDYIEKGDDTKCQFICKLCDCKFTDISGKDAHLRGRRHRLQYKRKVDPEIVLELPARSNGKQNKKAPNASVDLRREFGRYRQHMTSLRSRFEMEMSFSMNGRAFNKNFFSSYGLSTPEQFPSKLRLTPYDMAEVDRHVMAKHAKIYPTEEELAVVQMVVEDIEAALKAASDFFVEEEAKQSSVSPKKESDDEKMDENSARESNFSQELQAETPKERILKGVMRVGTLAKGLLLHGDMRIQLVVLCSEKPTVSLLTQLHQLLQKHFEKESSKYDLSLSVDYGVITVVTTKDPKVNLSVMLTSVLMRGESLDPLHPELVKANVDPSDVLNSQKCLEALALLRQAKWFQARCCSVPSALVVLRVMRELCQRVKMWTPVSNWALELLIEKVLTSSMGPLTPGEGIKRVFEAIAAGVFLPGSQGLLDPCEKDAVDATEGMTAQQREDITASAQQYLRLIAFKRIHSVLGMDKLLVQSSLKIEESKETGMLVVEKILSHKDDVTESTEIAKMDGSVEP